MTTWSRIQIKRTVDQDRELDRVICRFEQEFAGAWNRDSIDREMLQKARKGFDDIIIFLREVILLFSAESMDLLDLPSITHLQLPQEVEAKGWRSFNEWTEYASSWKYQPRVMLEGPELLWTLCPPIETPAVTLWSYTAPSAARVLLAFYYAFSHVIEQCVEETLAAPSRSRLQGYWRLRNGVIFPVFQLRRRQYHIPRKGEVFNSYEIPPSLADRPIPRSKSTTYTVTYEVHERWIWTDHESYSVEPSSAQKSFFRYSTYMKAFLAEANGLPTSAVNGTSASDADGSDRTMLRRLALGHHSEPMAPPNCFKPMKNAELATLLKVSTQTVAGYRRTAEGTDRLNQGSKMEPAIVRALLYYFAGWARGKDTQKLASAEIDKRGRGQIDPKPSPN